MSNGSRKSEAGRFFGSRMSMQAPEVGHEHIVPARRASQRQSTTRTNGIPYWHNHQDADASAGRAQRRVDAGNL